LAAVWGEFELGARETKALNRALNFYSKNEMIMERKFSK